MGKFSIVSTPVGNLEDISFRALTTIKEADMVLAEDTRTISNILKKYNIRAKFVTSFFEGNEQAKIPEILVKISEGQNIALVSESGTPLISDPGYKLVKELIKNNITVESVPGPTALITALTLSGLPPNSFLFLGFLPKKESKAKKILKDVNLALHKAESLKTVILYESPHRLLKTLYLIKEVFAETEVVVSRELTKIHEETRREPISSSIDHFQKQKPKGEFVISFSPKQSQPQY